MRRREFIALVGAATIFPLTTHGQQPSKPVIGYLHMASPEPYASMMSAFRDGLKEEGYVEGQNVAIEYRWAEGHRDRLPGLVSDLLSSHVSVLATGGGEWPPRAAKQATNTVPIVFVTSDPIASHLVESLSRPGPNITGVSLFTIELAPKRFGILRELVPHADTVAVLVDSSNSGGAGDAGAQVKEAAQAVGQKIEIFEASNAQEIDEAFNKMARVPVDALIVLSSPFFTDTRYQIVTLANHSHIPAMYPLRQYVLAGGLLSYGTSIVDAYRQSGVYTGRLLKGTKAIDLPVQQPTKFELTINSKAAKTLGLTIPQSLLATADEVIE
jgi:putative tryptophan/tyrosine transport system substrate-binding protein